MKYVSLDLETISLARDPKNILMFSFVVEDSKKETALADLPHITGIITKKVYSGTPQALAMNSGLFEIVAMQRDLPIGWRFYSELEWAYSVQKFLIKHFGDKKIVAAGKNIASFDVQFLPDDLKNRFDHRYIDPGPMMIDWTKDKRVPGLKTIKERLGIDGDVKHNAYDDAIDTISILRKLYKGEGK